MKNVSNQSNGPANRLPQPAAEQRAAAPREGADGDLARLIAAGKRLGYLTFDEVNAYLPDEAVDPEKIDALLVAL